MPSVVFESARNFDGSSADCPEGLSVLVENGIIREMTRGSALASDAIRRGVFSPLETLRQATSVAAEILMQDGKLGCVSPGAHADLIVVDGDPLENIDLLAQDGRHLALIMQSGKVVKNTLH